MKNKLVMLSGVLFEQPEFDVNKKCLMFCLEDAKEQNSKKTYKKVACFLFVDDKQELDGFTFKPNAIIKIKCALSPMYYKGYRVAIVETVYV